MELEVLQELGLDEREAKIYLSLLRTGSATASTVADETGINRTTTYDILAKLLEDGLVSYVICNNVKHFNATDPQQFLLDLKEKEKRLEELLPSLMKLRKRKKEKTSVEIFKGKEGIISVLKMILRDKKDYLFIGGTSDFCRVVPIYMPKFLKKAAALGIRGKLICESDFGKYEADSIGPLEGYKLISKEFVSTTTKVWGNKTGFFVFSEPYFAIVIDNKEISDRHRIYFRYLWKISKEPSEAHKKKTLVT